MASSNHIIFFLKLPMSFRVRRAVVRHRRWKVMALGIFLVVVLSLRSVKEYYVSRSASDSFSRSTKSNVVKSSSNPGPVSVSIQVGQTPKQDRHAYAFVIGGCAPELPTYRNYLYDILIATEILREDGSTADVVVFVQMFSGSPAEELPANEVDWLQTMGIKLFYIPKTDQEHDSFYSISLQKFRILQLTQYRRVLFMDADVITYGSLDYMFQTSEIKENFIQPGMLTPANAGFFMLAPYDTAMLEINGIIRATEDRNNAANNKVFFDRVKGWGHVIEHPDRWELPPWAPVRSNMNQRHWKFGGSSADQGLLYHWVKYHRKQVSIMLGDKVQNWGPGPNGTVVLEKTLHNPFKNVRKPLYRGLVEDSRSCPPNSDFKGFHGAQKPWLKGPPEDLSEATQNKTALHLWFWKLALLNKKLSLGLDEQLQNWGTDNQSRGTLGNKPEQDQNRGAHTDLLLPTVEARPLTS